jgi:hypothetical protein
MSSDGSLDLLVDETVGVGEDVRPQIRSVAAHGEKKMRK